MDFSWIIFTICVLIFAYRGYRQGVLGALARVAGLIVGYGAAMLFGAQVGVLLQTHTGLQGMSAYILGSLLVFFFTSMLVSYVFSFIQRILDKGKKRSTLANMLGVFTGITIGAVFGLIAVFAIGYFRDVFSVMQPANQDNLAERPISGIEQFSKNVAGHLIALATSSADAEPVTTKITTAMATNPGVVVKGLQQVVHNPAAKSLFSDPQNQRVLNSQDAQAIAALPAFKQLASNPDIQRLAAVSGMDTSNQQAFEKDLAGQFGSVWGRAQQLKDDPEVQKILQDPEFQQQLRSKNPMLLMNDPRFATLFSRLMNTPAATTVSRSDAVKNAGEKPSEPPSEPQKKENPVYKWIDDEGKIHYSDKPPPQ